jgi:hypothetical protein
LLKGSSVPIVKFVGRILMAGNVVAAKVLADVNKNILTIELIINFFIIIVFFSFMGQIYVAISNVDISTELKTFKMIVKKY